jgi:hypothetical protein
MTSNGFITMAEIIPTIDEEYTWASDPGGRSVSSTAFIKKNVEWKDNIVSTNGIDAP